MSSSHTITVLAGVNGAGKSSIAGEFAEGLQDFYFNPDSVALKICALHPDISVALANGHAWQIGKSLLEQAIAESATTVLRPPSASAALPGSCKPPLNPGTC